MNMGSDWSDPCDCPEGTVNRRGECISLVSDVNVPDWEPLDPFVDCVKNLKIIPIN
jgi:hypothetical protein